MERMKDVREEQVNAVVLIKISIIPSYTISMNHLDLTPISSAYAMFFQNITPKIRENQKLKGFSKAWKQ